MKDLETAQADPIDKCRALWDLITTGNDETLRKLLQPATVDD
jgi:hypothetical protein